MKIYNKTLPASLALASAVSLATAEMAMAEDVSFLEEIIVTAEKREASLQDTPISISAFSEDMRDNMGITSAADVANHTPGMTYNGNPNRIFIRGVGRVDNSLGSEPGVAIYKDGIYSNESTALSDSTFFSDRVEILRGPQGTLYGRNAIGGAAAVHSKKPTDDFEGAVRVGGYSFDGVKLGVSHSGPINDKVRYRVAAESDKNDGFVENKSGADQNGNDFKRWEVQFDIDLTENLNLWVLYQDESYDSSQIGAVMASPYNTTSPAPIAPVASVPDLFASFAANGEQLVPNAQFGHTLGNPTASDIHKVDWSEGGHNKQDGDRATVHLTYNFDNMQLKYIYGYNDYEWDYLGDYDKTGRSDLQYFSVLGQDERYEQHEIQLISDFGGDVEFIFGLFQWESENYQPLSLTAPNNPVVQTPIIIDFDTWSATDAPANPTGAFYSQYGDLETKSQAAYGQIDFYPTEKWHFALGLRYSKDEKKAEEYQRVIFDEQGAYAPLLALSFFDFSAVTNAPTPGVHSAWDLSNGGMTATHKDDWSSTDWSLGADYSFNDDTMVYGKVSTGYKAGGYRLGSLQENPAVDPESVMAWEIGLKTQFERAIINASAYYYDYEDMQVPVNVIDNGVSNKKFVNAKEAAQWGLEVDVQWAVTDALTLYSTYTYMNTEIKTMGFDVEDETDPAYVANDLSGNDLIKSPPHKFTLMADYTWALSTGDLKLVTAYVYTDSQYSTIFNDKATEIDSSERTDVRLTYLNNQHDLRVSAYVTNVFDEEIIESLSRSSSYTNNQLTASIQPPRMFGVEINYGF
ncbi:TonB-dependent receptor [Maricurvus nonylphenolicus]|uniref:TonB-dependent receptor n=1 Tax=Maricurvus nonylphenolicus TaxID=1008307 RepID=UPI0036F37475